MGERGLRGVWIEERSRWRIWLCRIATLGQHWPERNWTETSLGPAGAPDEEFETIGRFKLCRICYETVVLEP